MNISSPSKKKLREFGLFFGLIFPFFIGFLLPLIFDHKTRLWSLFFGLPFIMFGIFSPNKLKYFYKKWMNLSNFLASVNSHIVLGFIFILVMQPISLIMKLIGYDSLNLKKVSLKTYRKIRKDDNIDFQKLF